MTQTTEGQAALAGMVESMRRRQALAQRSTGPQFINLGRSFQINQESWSGPTVISPDALFLFRFERGFHQSAGYPDGLRARDLLAIPRDPLADTALAFITLDSADLPPLVTSHPDWPFPAIRECSVVIVPRDVVAQVLYVPGTNSLHFQTGGRLVQVGSEVMEPLAAAEHLRNIGWPTGRSSLTPPAQRNWWHTSPFIAGALGLAILAALTFSSSISSQLGLLLGLLLSAAALAMVARAWQKLRATESR